MQFLTHLTGREIGLELVEKYNTLVDRVNVLTQTLIYRQDMQAQHEHDFRGFDTTTNEEICLVCFARRKCTHRRYIKDQTKVLDNCICVLCNTAFTWTGK